MKRSLFFLFTGVMLLGVSCTEDENVGPQGPQGPAGNANVQSVIFTNRPFTYNQLANVYQVLVDVPQITSDIMTEGTVAAFVASANNNNSSWTALSGKFSTDITTYPMVEFDFQYSSGSATIYSTTNPNFGNVDLKIVVTAGSSE